MSTKRLKWVCGTCVCIVVLGYMAALTWLNISHFEYTLQRQSQRSLQSLARTQAEHLQTMIALLRRDLEIAATRVGAARSEATRQDELEDLGSRLSRIVEVVYLVGPDGRVISSAPQRPTDRGRDMSEDPDVVQALSAARPRIGDIMGGEEEQKALSICVPVLEEDRAAGLLRAMIPLNRLQPLVQATGLGIRGDAWIADDDGTILSHPNETFLGRSLFSLRLRQFGDAGDEDAVITGMLEGTGGVTRFVADRKTGQTSMIAWTPVQLGGRRWSLALSMDYDRQISLPIRMHAQNTFIMMGCFLCAFLLAAAFYVRMERRRSQWRVHQAIDRVNDELQLVSSERQSLSDRMRKQVQELSRIISGLPHCVFWKDTDSVYRGCNLNFAKAAGLSRPEDVTGKTDYDLAWMQGQADHMVQCDREVLRTGIPLLNMELEQQVENKPVVLSVSKVPLRDGRGRIVGILGIMVDVTAYREALSASEGEMSEVERILQGMEHGVILADEQGRIRQANSAALYVLNASRDEAIGQSLLSILPEDMLEAVEKMYDANGKVSGRSYSRKVSAGGKEYDFRVHPAVWEGRFLGLTLSFVDVTCWCREQERAEYANYRKNHFMASISHQIRTAMNDILGFTELLGQEPLEEQAKEYAGMICDSATALLGVVEEIVDASKVEAAEFQGDIPEPDGVDDPAPAAQESVDAVEAAPDGEVEGASESDADAGRILIVDDLQENRMLIDVLLKKEGYATEQCANGQEAVEWATKEWFDVILMDIQMPVMDGLEATRQIRGDEGPNRTTPILAMTAANAKSDELLCLEAGCDDCAGKPIQKEKFLRKVWRFAQMSRQIRMADKGGEITSFLEDNPDYQKAIIMFVENLPGRIQELQDALDEGNLQEAAAKVHSLKGLGGFAGFPIYTEKARELEEAIRGQEMEKVRGQVEELVELCRRTRTIQQ